MKIVDKIYSTSLSISEDNFDILKNLAVLDLYFGESVFVLTFFIYVIAHVLHIEVKQKSKMRLIREEH